MYVLRLPARNKILNNDQGAGPRLAGGCLAQDWIRRPHMVAAVVLAGLSRG